MPRTAPALAALRRRVNKLPAGPGVYRWLDASGHVLYVGKAKNLRSRMQHYVQAGAKRSAWTEIMVRQIADFDVTLVNSELESLLLEANLIKELRPKYNILLKDDKNYVYVRISTEDMFPGVDIVRRMEEDPTSPSGLRRAGGALYFGPKTSAEQVRETLVFLRSLFPFRNCKMGIEIAMGYERRALSGNSQSSKLKAQSSKIPLDIVCKDRDRPTPCVDYHIKQCLAPCIGAVTPEQYRRQAIDGVVAFFQGKHQEAERILTERMQEAAKTKKFERAAKLRDQLEKLKKTQEKQLISDTSHANTDTIGASLLSGHAYVVLLRERDGKLIGEENFSLQGTAESLADVLGQFLPQYLGAVSDLPDTIVVGEEPTDREAIESWLQSLRGRRVRLVVPERGKKSKLLELAEKNADWKARQTEAKWEAETRKTEEALKELQVLLKLPVLPRRIEGYDISHLGGTHTVGSMVVFHHGKPKREHYRSFNMYSLKEAAVDDYKALVETLRRRLGYLSGGLKQELKKWKEGGIVIRRARKSDWLGIEAVIKASPRDLSSDDLNQGEFFVAVRGNDVVGCCRLFQHVTGLFELRSVCIAKAEQGQRLGHSLVRALLSKQKLKKVYIINDPDLEQYYAEIGFRHILKVPPVLEQKIERLLAEDPHLRQPVVMVYDPTQHKADDSFTSVPDLLLVDGGKGQLSTAVQVLAEFGLKFPVAGLAKREEEIFVPPPPPTPPPRGEGSKEPDLERTYGPLKVPQDSAARFLLQRVRDEAHRFANSKREGRQKASTFRSQLDEIPGIGEATKKALLEKFGSAETVFSASDDELSEILTESQIENFRKFKK